MLTGEPWTNPPGEYFALAQKSLSRQRVAARNRPENITTSTVKTKIITRRQRMGMRAWMQRWLPWFPAPAGGRL